MTTIKVKHLGYKTAMNEDGEFRCPHENVEIKKPCCSVRGSSGYIECGCGGQYSVYCHDCKNEDLQEWEAQDILNDYLDRRAYDEC